MAVPGPTDRQVQIDDNTPTLQIWDPILVSLSGAGAIDESLHDLTGPTDTTPVILPAGFSRAQDSTCVFQADVGGSNPADPTTAFYVNRGTSRTFTITYASGWTFSDESYIATATPQMDPELLGLLEVTFRHTGTISVT